jgi:hypothetical protein
MPTTLKTQLAALVHGYKKELFDFGRRAVRALEDLTREDPKHGEVIVQLQTELDSARKQCEAEIHKISHEDLDLQTEALIELDTVYWRKWFIIDEICMRRDLARSGKSERDLIQEIKQTEEAIERTRDNHIERAKRERIQSKKDEEKCRNEAERAEREQLKEELEALKNAVYKKATSEPEDIQAQDEEKPLKWDEEADGLVVWLDGRRYDNFTADQTKVVKELLDTERRFKSEEYLLEILEKDPKTGRLRDTFNSRPGYYSENFKNAENALLVRTRAKQIRFNT